MSFKEQKYVDKDILRELRIAIATFMKENNVNWGNYQKTTKEGIFLMPLSRNTLRYIYTGRSVHVNSIKLCLDFFKIPYSIQFGLIKKYKEDETI